MSPLETLSAKGRIMRRLHAPSILSALLMILAPSLSYAQQAGGSLASQERQITGGDLALISYIALWVLVLGVIVVVFFRQKKLNAELEHLERKLDERLGVDRKEA